MNSSPWKKAKPTGYIIVVCHRKQTTTPPRQGSSDIFHFPFRFVLKHILILSDPFQLSSSKRQESGPRENSLHWNWPPCLWNQCQRASEYDTIKQCASACVTKVRACACACMLHCVHALFTHVCVCVCVFVCVHKYVHMHACVCVCVCPQVFSTCLYVCACIHAHVGRRRSEEGRATYQCL